MLDCVIKIAQIIQFIHHDVNCWGVTDAAYINNSAPFRKKKTYRQSHPDVFYLHAIIDHHGQLLGSGHYTASVVCCNDVYYCNDNRSTVYDIGSIRDSPTVYIMII